jgi:hypothetical protein
MQKKGGSSALFGFLVGYVCQLVAEMSCRSNAGWSTSLLGLGCHHICSTGSGRQAYLDRPRLAQLASNAQNRALGTGIRQRCLRTCAPRVTECHG